MQTKKLIIAISGASGAIYGIRMLEVLKDVKSVETHAIISTAAEKTIKFETEYSIDTVRNFADFYYDPADISASIASGSFLNSGMVIIPCSMKSLSGIVNSYNDNLLTRAADVTLKEKRKLIICPRETPLHKGHLELLLRLVDYGGMVLPPFPAFYHSPQTLSDIIDQTVGKVLDQFDIKHSLYKRWSEG
ncbi:UbiX family flavin prenyltransferase [bacterium]|nr:UbiX family flavin prenyltransferase [bacterium]